MSTETVSPAADASTASPVPESTPDDAATRRRLAAFVAAADDDALPVFRLTQPVPSGRLQFGERIDPNVCVRGMRDNIRHLTDRFAQAERLAAAGTPVPATDYWPRVPEEILARESADLESLFAQMEGAGLLRNLLADRLADKTGRRPHQQSASGHQSASGTNALRPVSPVIYTGGYSGKTVGQLFETAKRLGGQVIDVRLNPWSQRPEWCKAALGQVFGARYESVTALGNAQRKNPAAPDILADWPFGLQRIRYWLEKGRSPILLCQCYDEDDCHRSVIIERLADCGLMSQPLPWLERGEAA